MKLSDLPGEKTILGLDVKHPETGEIVKLRSCFNTSKESFGFWYDVPGKKGNIETFYVDSLDEIEVVNG